MKTTHVLTILLVAGIVGLIGFSAPSFADWGRGGRGGGYCDGPGAGDCPRGYGGRGFAGGLSDEQIAALEKERSAFFEQTRGLREEINQKDLELRSELAKQAPDAERAAALQKEISGLEGELDQKTLEHRIKLRKENPQIYGRGMGPGYGRGPGYGMGPGFGRGPGYGMGPGSGRGPCWQ